MALKSDIKRGKADLIQSPRVLGSNSRVNLSFVNDFVFVCLLHLYVGCRFLSTCATEVSAAVGLGCTHRGPVENIWGSTVKYLHNIPTLRT